MAYEQILSNMLGTLEKHLNTQSIIGEPVTIGDVTLIPVMDLMFGYGGGAGQGKDEKHGGGDGSGGGAGARLSPKAMVVIRGGEVEVLPFTKGSAVEKIVEAIPALMDRFVAARATKAEPEAEAKTE